MKEKIIKNKLSRKRDNKNRRDILNTKNKYLPYFFKPDFINKKTEKKLNQMFQKRIIIVGSGGTGSNLAVMLARTDFKNVSIVDNDIVEFSNLNRQVYTLEHIGKKKVYALKEIIEKINNSINYEFIPEFLTEENYNEILKDYDLIVDCSDNFKTRKIINKYCEENNKDWLYVAASRAEFTSYIFRGDKKEFNKIFKNKRDSSTKEEGIFPAAAIMASSLAYTNIIKYFSNKEIKFIKINLWNDNFFVIK